MVVNGGEATSEAFVFPTKMETDKNKSFKSKQKSFREALRSHWEVCRANPQVPLLAIFLFLILFAAGIVLAIVFRNAREDTLREEATSLAEDTGLFFSQNLDNAILPLFSLAQFVKELDVFRSLVEQIGPAFEEGSLPFLNNATQRRQYHRNITGVCDEPELVGKFNQIAGTIKENAKMDGILVNLQIVPDGVVCLVYPLNNTEDFPPGIYMDNSGAVGHDLLTDPARKFIAEATVPSDDVVIAGPLTLQQCEDCDPFVEKGFIARLPIKSDTNVITVNGVGYPSWGFAVAIINWKELVQRSGVYELFRERGFEFQLTRTDKKPDADTGIITEKVVVLAESEGFDVESKFYVTTDLDTTNNEWQMTVTYCDGKLSCTTPWFPLVVAFIAFLSFCVSFLVYIIFNQARMHAEALNVKSVQMVDAARQAAKTERELNDFIAHEVRNPIAAALSACSFVSVSVNETEPLVDSKSKESVREDVKIIESSLKFVNDLLRSMLDLHRARSKQLVLEVKPCCIKRDILDSVASMLYQRDENFDVIVECPDDMIAEVDGLRLKQIVLNLARNAAKFVEQGFVRLRAETTHDGISIYVEDSGPGIPEEKRKQLFAKFQESLDSLSQGTGIGLSLCQKLIDLMNGSIVLDESYNSGIEGNPGAKFDIRLKCKLVSLDASGAVEVHEPTVELGDDSPVQETKKEELPDVLSVLFVDDDVVLRKLFSRSLKRVKPEWDIDEAANGESALVLVKTKEYDIIFIDQYMTSVEKQLLGTETCRHMRMNGVQSLICGLSANDMESAFHAAGANAFMIKPFPCQPKALHEELTRIWNRKETAEEMT